MELWVLCVLKDKRERKKGKIPYLLKNSYTARASREDKRTVGLLCKCLSPICGNTNPKVDSTTDATDPIWIHRLGCHGFEREQEKVQLRSNG